MMNTVFLKLRNIILVISIWHLFGLVSASVVRFWPNLNFVFAAAAKWSRAELKNKYFHFLRLKMNSSTDDTLTHLVETCNKMWSEYVPFRINHFLKLILCHLRAIESHQLTELIKKLKTGHIKIEIR